MSEFPIYRPAAALAVTVALAACGPSQQHAGFSGFPPAEVTTQVIAPHNFPIAFEYVGQTLGSKKVIIQ